MIRNVSVRVKDPTNVINGCKVIKVPMDRDQYIAHLQAQLVERTEMLAKDRRSLNRYINLMNDNIEHHQKVIDRINKDIQEA